MNIDKIAKQDASNWARAEMFFGEGAGTRRKLLWAEISDKGRRIPGYSARFEKAYSKQNMADHAIKAAKERARLDRSGFLKKHTKALLRGDRRNEIVGLMLLGYAAHQMGYDKIALEKAKKIQRKVKTKIAERKLANGGKIL